MDVQRDTYCPIAMARAEGGEADLFGVVDAALRVTEANGLPNHADRHAGDGEDPIISLGAHDLTGNMTLDANVDILADDDYSNDLGSEPSPFLDIYGNYLRLRGRFGVGLPTVGTRYYRGTYAVPTNVLNNDVLFQLRMYGRHGGAGGWDEGGRIELLATQAWTFGGDSGACMKFWVIDQNDGNPSEYLRLDGNGERIRAYRSIQMDVGMDIEFAGAGSTIGTAALHPDELWGESHLFPDGLAALPAGWDTYGVIFRTDGGGGAAPFNQAGSLIYRARVHATGGRSNHYFYCGNPSLERARITPNGIQVPAGMEVDCYTNGGYLKPRRVSQAARPVPDTGELLVWRDTDDDKTYLVYEDPDVGTRQVEMT
jgi:hypothetical protein